MEGLPLKILTLRLKEVHDKNYLDGDFKIGKTWKIYPDGLKESEAYTGNG